MNIGGLIGLLSVILSGVGYWFFYKRIAKKKRLYDEVYKSIQHQAFLLSWYITLATVFMILVIVLLGVSLSALKVITIIFIVQLFSFASVMSYKSLRIYAETKGERQLQIASLLLFIVLGTAFLCITILYIN